MEIPDNAIWKTETGPHLISAQTLKDLAGRVVISFHVSSHQRVDVLHNQMTAAGHPGLQSPYDALWRVRYAVIEDPDGIAVGIMSPVSAEQRSSPPAI